MRGIVRIRQIYLNEIHPKFLKEVEHEVESRAKGP